MPKLLDRQQIDRFWNDGFLPFHSGVPASEVAAIRQTLTALHTTNRGFREGALFDAVGIDDGREPQRFPQILHPRSFAPALVRGEFFRSAQAIARQLLGDAVRFKADISLRKPARIGAVTPWHQDEAFMDPDWDYQEVSFWLALQPTDRSNSCMEYLPGTHRGEVLPHGFPGGDSRVHALECVSGFDPAQRVPCPVPAGGCVIHTQRTLHYAGPNLSEHDRFAYVLIFDRVPTPARQRREFPWRVTHQTARSERERAWRRQGGLVVHLWRQRARLRLHSPRHLIFDLRRAIAAMRHLREVN
jgi:ectoine hydroxylase-related dioxygenase (phytanoyl-CoA dioxygenase family)